MNEMLKQKVQTLLSMGQFTITDPHLVSDPDRLAKVVDEIDRSWDEEYLSLDGAFYRNDVELT
jgi:hypothetical protein